jgi:hypothetical protein
VTDTDAQVAARTAVRIAVGEIDAGNLVQRLEQRLSRQLALEVFARERNAGLGHRLVIGDTDAANARGADHHFGHVFFGCFGAGRLCEGVLRETGA